ncbi:hypothetical protein [Stenomitos frigidus]|uniref:Uncharacterized protein n=1 Tax=Stenomitos frigidus ULC18 TaxID=2107698 RepID=A0A2T1DY99_9CYAN|nr:hypothetical protein [Stenomitos frigidus]PSB25468.1 hypothetical protein C7B82_22840 [Stenomitos frigidus ULC18]
MPDVLIVVDSLASATTAQMVSALQNAILGEQESEAQTVSVDVMTASELVADNSIVGDRLLCPLTLDLPETLPLTAQAVYTTCRHTDALRQQLQHWDYATGVGNFWLPIVLTVKGPLYAEVIGMKADRVFTTSSPEPCYEQPIHLSDVQRQPLYALGQRLLRSLKAPPAVYLMQFGWQDDALCFDRLFPFPAAPAVASLNVQAPDLFACHWSCLTGKSLFDFAIGCLS